MDLDPLKDSNGRHRAVGRLVAGSWARLSGGRRGGPRPRPDERTAPAGVTRPDEPPGSSAGPPPCSAPEPGRRRLTVGITAAVIACLVLGVAVAPAVIADSRGRAGPSAQPTASTDQAATPPLLPATAPVQPDPPTGSSPSTPGATPDLDLSSSPTAAPSTVGVPTLVDIPAIGVHASITPLGLGADGVIQVPDQFSQAGWYDGGPRPGDSGPAVLLGHVDSQTGPAVFFRLKDLHPGDTVTVTSSTGTVAFTVDSVAEYPKTAFPTAAVYGPVSDRALRLVTCGGKFDDSRHSYLSNVIVFATAAA